MVRSKRIAALMCASLIAVSFLAACGSGDNASFEPIFSLPSTTHVVTLSWAPNRETSVNSAGGYYEVTISGQPTFTVPYTVTSVSTVLSTGNYKVTLRAHATLDSQGSTTGAGTFSAPPAPLSVRVP